MEELGISLGEETITVQKKLQFIGFRFEGANTPGGQKLYIEYYIGSSYKQVVIEGYELYDFYMNKWTDAQAIINKIKEVENLPDLVVDLVTAENQFVVGLPTELPTPEFSEGE